MFRKFFIAVITAVAAILETAADAIAATLPRPVADSARLRVVAGLCPPATPGSAHRTLREFSPGHWLSRVVGLAGQAARHEGKEDRSASQMTGLSEDDLIIVPVQPR